MAVKRNITSQIPNSCPQSDEPARLPELLRKNTSSEEQAIRAETIIWFHRDRESNCRVIHELALGDRRIDLVFVYPSDIVGVEIKGPRDSLSDGRMAKQMREYNFWLPEVWLAVDQKWWGHDHVKSYSYMGNTLVWGDGLLTPRNYTPKKAHRDEMCCSRLLDLLWNDEVRMVGNQHRLLSQTSRINSTSARRVKGMLARMLTGHEVMKAVCDCLRARPMHMVGAGSTEPISRSDGLYVKNPNQGLASSRLI